MTSLSRIILVFVATALTTGLASADSVITDSGIKVLPAKPPAISAMKDGEAKIYSFDDWNIDNKIIFSNLRLTLIHNTPPSGPKSISVRLSFHQYNKTENDKGTHSAGLTLQLLGASNNILAVHFGGNNITRDACRDMGDHLFGPDNIPDDIWELITSASVSYHATWDYEGGC